MRVMSISSTVIWVTVWDTVSVASRGRSELAQAVNELEFELSIMYVDENSWWIDNSGPT